MPQPLDPLLQAGMLGQPVPHPPGTPFGGVGLHRWATSRATPVVASRRPHGGGRGLNNFGRCVIGVTDWPRREPAVTVADLMAAIAPANRGVVRVQAEVSPRLPTTLEDHGPERNK